MTTTPTTTTTRSDEWTAPGPGAWRAETAHSVGAMTPVTQYVIGAAQPAAMRQVFAQWGIPADTTDVKFINGHMYHRLRPLVGADKPVRKPPPAAILKLLVRVHPEFRRRTRLAALTLANRPWRQTIADWSTTIRPEWERRNLALQDVDLAELDADALADHIDAVVAHALDGMKTHFVLHASDLGPIGLLLVFCEDHGIAAEEVVPALVGASPSTSQPARLLEAMRADVTASGRTPGTVDELRSIAPAIDDYLRLRGTRIVSRYDVDGATLAEVPELILASVLHGTKANEHDSAGTIAALRAKVPAEHRREFDELLADARACMDLRDDNGPYTVEWPLGLLRVAMLEAGRRLTESGALTQVDHALELTQAELTGLLRGTTQTPDRSEVAGRAIDRARRSLLDAPELVGTPEPPPPAGTLPAPAERLIRVVTAVTDKLARGEHADDLHGTGIGTRPYTGVVRRADSPEAAIAQLEPGEILVVPFTTPAYNVVLPLAGAIVTAEGGPLSHAAVLARELDLPAIVGASGALALVNGATITVDPRSGQISVPVTAGI
jgi:pyruvate,water dikinase